MVNGNETMSNIQNLARYYKEYVFESTISILTDMENQDNADVLAENYINIIRNANYKQIITECDSSLYKNAFAPMCIDNVSLRVDLDKITVLVRKHDLEIIALKSDNAKLLSDNAKLLSDNAKLLSDNAKLFSDNAKLIFINIAFIVCIFSQYIYFAITC
ncbi:hypothetical protein EPVG_00182 [Emiliania huxleyi virus 201]|nr:hypothetical protein ELVG_00120 [Emiliania huxleyi virus 203]AEP15527.1 hypothetical protein EQVG_00117 [Emiliania huxleyi virus 207]AEP15949.1 hypothetical protein ERVG_00071 [Emiliania huxleyi virus 208]AET98069.1 hypothetical protein EPVG_00182 [Emiliania huxleyi virus 201]